MKITALVVWPTSVEIEIPDSELEGLSQEDRNELIREKLLDDSGDILATSTIKPVIQECSIPELGD